MSLTDGQDWNQTRARRLQQSIPTSYTIWNDSGTYRAECNIAGGTDYPGATLKTLIDNVASSADRLIHFREGTYTLTDYPVISNDRVYFVGDGPGTKFTQANGTNLAHFFSFQGVYSGGVSNLRIYGNGLNQTEGTSGVHIGTTSTRVQVNNCEIDTMYNFGVLVDGSATHNWIVDDYIGSCENSAVHLQYAGATAAYNTVARNHMYAIDSFGVGCTLADRNNILDNVMVQLPTDTYNEGVNLNRSCHNLVQGNKIYATGDCGIVVHSGGTGTASWGNQILGNDVGACLFAGIHLTEVSPYNIVKGNFCWNNNQANDQVNKHPGILIDTATTTYNLIEGNFCTDTQGAKTQTYGIYEHTNTDYNIIRNNQCYNHLTAPYKVIGAHNTYDGAIQSEQVQINGATTIPLMTFINPIHIARAKLQYSTAVANDTNVTVGYARDGAADADYYVTSVTSGTGNIWATQALTLAKNDVTVGDTITFTQDGSGGAGEYIRLIIDYLTGA